MKASICSIDAPASGAVAVTMPTGLISQVADGVPAKEMFHQEALGEELLCDTNVCLLGEDIGKRRGALGVTQ
jgi:hypothetical protein